MAPLSAALTEGGSNRHHAIRLLQSYCVETRLSLQTLHVMDECLAAFA